MHRVAAGGVVLADVDGDQNIACAFSFIPRFIIKIKKASSSLTAFFSFFGWLLPSSS
jgi:hypothetical protein